MKQLHERITNPKAKHIFEAVRRQGTVSKQDLLERSGLSVSTLTRMLDELTEQGLLLEVGFGESTGGRRPILYRINSSYGFAFGLEISRTLSRLVLTDMNGTILAERVWSMTSNVNPDRLFARVETAVADLLKETGKDRSSVLGLGVGAVGPLDPARGMILNPRYFAGPGWTNVPVCEKLEQILGLPVLLDNGANTALIGEYWADEDKHGHLLYVHVGIGLRSAMMSGGKLVYGAIDMEGAVGQMIIEANGIPSRTPDGNDGALESYVSLFSLEQKYLSKLGGKGTPEIGKAAGSRRDENAFSAILGALGAGEAAALELLKEAAVYMGIGLANLLNILHPEKVYLGGPLVNAHPSFYETAVETALKRTYYYPTYRASFSKGTLGETALAAGAAVMVINRLSE